MSKRVPPGLTIALCVSCGAPAPSSEDPASDGSDEVVVSTEDPGPTVREARIACAAAHRCLLDECTDPVALEDALTLRACDGDPQNCYEAALATAQCVSACTETLAHEEVCGGDPGSLVCESLRLTPAQVFLSCDMLRGSDCQFVTERCENWTPPADPGC